MNLKLFTVGLKSLILISFKSALQQRALLLFMEGKYSRNWNEDDCENMETVKIKQVSGSGDIYKIVRVWWKQEGPDKEVYYKQKVDKWLATYDYSKRQLLELGGNRKCSFLIEDQVLFLNASKFEKTESLKQDCNKQIN